MALQELKKKKKKNGKNAGASHRTERLAKPPSLELSGDRKQDNSRDFSARVHRLLPLGMMI